MPRINELPETPKYRIKAVSLQTGVPPVTLRAWERRYGLLNPQRTPGNYRLYSDRDIALLRWTKARVDSGLPIRLAAEQALAMRRSDDSPEALPPLTSPEGPAGAPDTFARRLYESLTRHDEARASQILGQSHAVFDLATICLRIITPCLVEIGEAWHRGDIRIATEHFASSFLRGRLLALYQTFPTARGSKRILVGCAPGEFHEIGSLMLALFLRRAGHRVDYLGQDVALDDVLAYARSEPPSLICLSASLPETARRLAGFDAGLAGIRPRPAFGFGGRAFNVDPGLRDEIQGVFLGETSSEGASGAGRLLTT
jgi:DNA-binding transcriptional MerR regulator